MDAVNVYHALYSYLEYKTPLKTDCGIICNKACCISDDPDAGMYLFPQERNIYSVLPKWAKIEKSDFYSGGVPVDILICEGKCTRELRPLSCRIFPLVPYVQNGKLSVIIDPRGKGICPLATVSEEFFRAVWNVSRFLYKIKETRCFIYSLSEQIDEHIKLF